MCHITVTVKLQLTNSGIVEAPTNITLPGYSWAPFNFFSGHQLTDQCVILTVTSWSSLLNALLLTLYTANNMQVFMYARRARPNYCDHAHFGLTTPIFTQSRLLYNGAKSFSTKELTVSQAKVE